MFYLSKKLALKTKIKLYNSNVKSVLLYGAECWRTVETVDKPVKCISQQMPKTNLQYILAKQNFK